VILVVGSEPAGASTAVAVLANGNRMTVIDASLRLAPERRDVARAMDGPACVFPADMKAKKALVESRGVVLGGSRLPVSATSSGLQPFRAPGPP
jgi:hypothetical protein